MKTPSTIRTQSEAQALHLEGVGRARLAERAAECMRPFHPLGGAPGRTRHSGSIRATLGLLAVLLTAAGCEEEPKPSTAVPGTNALVTAVASAPANTNTAPTIVTPPVPVIAAKPPPALHPSVAEIARFAEAGVEEPVMLAYLDTIQGPISLHGDEIIYLTDLGVSGSVITALLRFAQTSTSAAVPQAATHGAPVNATATVATQPPAATAPAEAPPIAATDGNAPAEPAPGAAPAAPGSEPPPAPASQVTQTYFYETLSPYGTWVTVPGYGWCWRPTVAVGNPAWRPYCDRGRWYYTDCGWYWHSDYSWGYVPFHYGRWCSDVSLGWVWVPGTVWGPSWVTWRYGGGYCGWAPLPPAAHYSVGVGFTYYGSGVAIGFGFGLSSSAYCYVPTAYVCDYRPWVHAVPVGHANSFHGKTTVINNYIQGNGNNVIVNAGVSTDLIASSAKGEIRRASLRDVTPGSTPNSQPDRLIRGGSELAVYRPNLPAQAPEPPTHVRSRGEVSRSTTATTPTSGAGGVSHIAGGGAAGISTPPVAGSVPTGSSGPRALPMSSRRNPAPVGGEPLPAGSAVSGGAPAAPSTQASTGATPAAGPTRVEPRRAPASSLVNSPADRSVSSLTPSGYSTSPRAADASPSPQSSGATAVGRRPVLTPGANASVASTPTPSTSTPQGAPASTPQPTASGGTVRTSPSSASGRSTPTTTDSRQEVRRAPGSTSAFPPPSRYSPSVANGNAPRPQSPDTPAAATTAPHTAIPATPASGPTIVRANRPSVAEPSRSIPGPAAPAPAAVQRPATPSPAPQPAYSPASRQVTPQSIGRPSYAPQALPNQPSPSMRTQPSAVPQSAPYSAPISRPAPMVNPTPVTPRVQSYSPPPAPVVQPAAPPMRSAPAPAPAPSGGGGGGGGFGGRRQPN